MMFRKFSPTQCRTTVQNAQSDNFSGAENENWRKSVLPDFEEQKLLIPDTPAQKQGEFPKVLMQ